MPDTAETHCVTSIRSPYTARAGIMFVLSILVAWLSSSGVQAAVIFSDTFDAGASPLWGNESGAWSDAGGVYTATQPNNFPNAYSSLPFALTDFAIEVDINNVADGGIWLRSNYVGSGAVGVEGVLLVTQGNQLYWHIASASSYGGILNPVGSGGAYNQVKVEVTGDVYAAYINGQTSPITTLTTSQFASGQAGLYVFAGQSFDNVVLTAVPIPPAGLLLASGLCLVGLGARKRL